MIGGGRYGEVHGLSCEDIGICRHLVDVDGVITIERTLELLDAVYIAPASRAALQRYCGLTLLDDLPNSYPLQSPIEARTWGRPHTRGCYIPVQSN